MANADTVAYNIAVFITSLFLLEFGADKFIDHTTIVAHRTGISETLIGLLTAGAEWEELAVVIAALARNRGSLAIGNIVGSSISNILGAFSLGLVFHDQNEPLQFDQSSRAYSLVLLALTTFTMPILYFPADSVWMIHGTLLIAFFVIYIVSVGWAISRGRLTAPEGSDSGSSSGSDDTSDSDSSDGEEASNTIAERRRNAGGDRHGITEPFRNDSSQRTTPAFLPDDSTIPLLPGKIRRKRKTLTYHISFLSLGFAAICLSGYVLSHAASTIVDEFKISDVLFGVVILAIATTLPEKFIAVMSGRRGHAGVLVANTAGSNIFLLTLCSGIVMLDTKGSFPRGNVGIFELAVLWGSTVACTATVWFGARLGRWVGGAMVVAYIGFVVLEIAVEV
ncbi:hypothetical protein NX059_011093 [Plenodomus lindquistii]|nr:hypothetical protein NX059_011093 [Plenodomus lindquistii]